VTIKSKLEHKPTDELEIIFMSHNKYFLLFSFLAIFIFNSVNSIASADEKSDITINVFKSPTCGCCSKWIEHLEDNQFKTSFVNADDMSVVKKFYKIPSSMQSCHTGVVKSGQNEYIFEGHIPAKTIERFLQSPPANAIGLSVPGMPIGSPGMEMGDRKDYYEVYVIYSDGSSKLFEKING
jgi:hypothetical protein